MEYSVAIFTVCFVCLAFMFGVCPSQEFWDSGFTLENVLSRWLGSEEESFVLYNIRRLSATLLFQACLPLLYILLLGLWYPEFIKSIESVDEFSLMTTAYVIAVSFCLAVLSRILYHRTFRLPLPLWSNSPTAARLGRFASHLQLGSWWDVAEQIDAEYQEVDKFTSILSGWNARTVVTRSWIIKLGQNRIDFARQDLCQLEVVRADSHSVSQQGDVTGAQYVTIRVSTAVAGISDFFLRLNSREFEDFKRHVVAPVRVPEGILVVKSVVETFLTVFQNQVSLNEKVSLLELPNRELEFCVGCYLVPAEVKLRKCCEGDTCVACRCRPMWCVSCMGMWFAHQQDQQVPERWMTGTAPCPNCRAVFCILDVCRIES